MTKAKIIETIQNEEARAWMEYNRYCWVAAPSDLDYKGVCDWQSEDPNARAYRSTWAVLHGLIEKLGIDEVDNIDNKEAWDYHSLLYKQAKENEKTA